MNATIPNRTTAGFHRVGDGASGIFAEKYDMPHSIGESTAR